MADENYVDELKNEGSFDESTVQENATDNEITQSVDQAGEEDVADAESESMAVEPLMEVESQEDPKKDEVAHVEDKKDDFVNSKKKITSNKSMSKKKKGAIALVATLCIVAIALAVVLPVVFYRQPRIFVKSADQFVAGNKVGGLDKYFYSLDKNINCDNLAIEDDNVYSIDMNKRSLTVNGEFSIKTSKEGTLYIGTRKSNTEYTSNKASIKANSIRIDAPNMDVVLMADITCTSLSVVGAKSLQVGSFLSGEDKIKQMDISIENTDQVRFSGNIPGTTTSNIDIYGAKVTIDGGVTITNPLHLYNGNLMVNNSATLATIELDGNSRAIVYGAITNSLIGGAQVTMEDGHSCNTYQDINTLVIYRDIKKSHLIKNCKNVIYVEKLAKPVDINIQEIGNRVFCNVTRVKHASGYSLYINDEKITSLSGELNTTFDITDYVKDIGTYKVSVIPTGNFNDDADLTNAGHCTMYVDGDATSVNYNCVMTLQSPQNLKIKENNDELILEFDKVLHADYYLVYVDGLMVVRNDVTATTEDLSRYVGVIGDHSIRVQAFSMNENIHASSVSMISYSTTIPLEPVDIAHLTATLNSEYTAINVTWHGTANGYEYIVYLQVDGNPNRIYEVGRTSVVDETGAVVYTINFEELPEDLNIEYDPESDTYFDVFVVAAEHDYFEKSVESSCRVRKPTVSTMTSLY